MMRSIIFSFLVFIIFSCTNDKVQLIYFNHYDLDTINEGLGLDSCLIEINREGKLYKAKIMVEAGGHYNGEHIQGDYKVKGDTIFLGYQYIKRKDKYPNSYFPILSTVTYEYHFKTDSNYVFAFGEGLNFCGNN